MAQPPPQSTPAALGAADGTGLAGRFGGQAPSGGIRGRAARGTLVNAAFLIGFNLLGLVKGFAVAAFLTVEDYGIWGLLAVSLSTLLFLVQVGVDDKYIQQDAPDQKVAFELAFTLQALLCGAFVVVILAAMPLYALAYGEWDILAPGYVLALAMPAIALQAPLWTFYRRMDYLRQRTLQAFDPVVGLVVTLVLAAAGLGYWALVLGMVVGAWAAALAAVRAAPYRLALRYERAVLREYVRFSGPLFLSAVSGVLIAQIPVLIAQRSVGLAGVGAIAIATTITAYANRVDEIVTDTLYPAVCAVRDRIDLLQESFLKSNRLALLWAVPTGAAVVLFAPDLVTYVLGRRWEDAVFVIQAFAVAAAVNQIGFNWSAFFRALDQTRPIAVASAVMLASVMAIAVPLLLWRGIDGFAVGMGLATLVYVVARMVYLKRLFPLRGVLVNAARGAAPALPALAAVLAARALGGAGRDLWQVAVELALFVAVAVGATYATERALLDELRGYLRRGRPTAPVASS
jgi:PST family polysaccharide transporter